MTAPEMPEPADGTALYWPETETHIAAIAVRDDSFYGVVDDRHWRLLGLDAEELLTWGELWALCHQVDAPIAEAIVLTRPAEDAEQWRIWHAQVADALENLRGEYRHLMGENRRLRDALHGHPTDAEVDAAAFAFNDARIDPDDPFALARAALTAAARVRNGQAVTP